MAHTAKTQHQQLQQQSSGMSGNDAWRSPSVAHQAKYRLVAELPEDFSPTEEEQSLLTLYDTIKKLERDAKRLKEKQIRDKLASREEEFNKLQSSKKRKRRNRQKAKATPGSGAEASADDNGDDDDSMGSGSEDEHDDDEYTNKEAKRAAKLEELREEVNLKKKAMSKESVEEKNKRDRHLAQNEDVDLGPAPLQRKKKDATATTQDGESLLLSSGMMNAQQTPPHEFSKKLGLQTWKGKVLFPNSTTPKEKSFWKPPEGSVNPNEGAFLVELDDFDIAKASNGTGNNTVALKFNVPGDSQRFSVNIGGPGHNKFNSVLFHFNPRQFEKGGQLVVNDKDEGVWGQSIGLPLSQVPLIFGQTAVTLQIQINGEGFDIFIDEKHCARLEHRQELPTGSCSLFLQLPSTDDYGSREDWLVYKAWWGKKAIMAKGDVSNVPGVNSFNSKHPRKLFVSGLERISTESEVDIRRAELERAFRKYGGAQGVTCVVPTNTTFAFVEMENERMADLALSEMGDKYRLNRARRSRYEALLEERAAVEAEKLGKPKEHGGW